MNKGITLAVLVLYLMMIFVLAFYTMELGPRTIPIIIWLKSLGIVILLSIIPSILGYVIGMHTYKREW